MTQTIQNGHAFDEAMKSMQDRIFKKLEKANVFKNEGWFTMREYLCVIIISPDGSKEWQGQGIAVPRKGEDIIIRDSAREEVFSGEVKNVCWSYREGELGVVVTVFLKD